jgi:N-acetylneuraminate synthase
VIQMASKVKIGDRMVGDGEPCYVIAEIGINHNGDVGIARKLISAAVVAGADAVKFQKRTVDVVYAAEDLARPRESPFGTTNGDLKRHLELSLEAYREIDQYCRIHSITWFGSCWDEASVDALETLSPPCYKIASPSLTDDNLLRHHRRYKKPLIVSTGMSTIAEIDHAVGILGTDNLILMHCVSTYPSKPEELNLTMIRTLKERYQVPVGYSGHEVGLQTSVAAVALGACMIERHLTLDRSMWGSDQAASVEPQGLSRLVRDVRAVESAMGDGVKRVLPDEITNLKKLRRVANTQA